jgi:hypothetical protein
MQLPLSAPLPVPPRYALHESLGSLCLGAFLVCLLWLVIYSVAMVVGAGYGGPLAQALVTLPLFLTSLCIDFIAECVPLPFLNAPVPLVRAPACAPVLP